MLQAGQAEVISNSSIKVHQTWSAPLSESPYMKFLLSNVLLMMRLLAWKEGRCDAAGMNLADMIIRLKVLDEGRRPSLSLSPIR